MHSLFWIYKKCCLQKTYYPILDNKWVFKSCAAIARRVSISTLFIAMKKDSDRFFWDKSFKKIIAFFYPHQTIFFHLKVRLLKVPFMFKYVPVKQHPVSREKVINLLAPTNASFNFNWILSYGATEVKNLENVRITAHVNHIVYFFVSFALILGNFC